MVDRASLETSLRAVGEAHRVLASFHGEVVAFFRVLEEQLADDEVGCALTPFSEGDFVWTSASSAKKVGAWVPSYLGRLYYDETLQVPDGQPETCDSRAVAVVAIWARDGGALPECWFGLGRPGEGTRFKNSWDFGRYGVWNWDLADPPTNAWERGSLDGYASAGTGGVWSMRRTPLIELTSADQVRALVARPLLAEWKSVVRDRSPAG
jgi:hypothetical protein